MTILETPVPILQHPGEFDQLLTLYTQHQPNRVLEIGTLHGGTLYHWLRNATPHATIVSVDHQIHANNTNLYPDWTPPNVQLHVISGDSTDQETIEQVAHYAPYDWIFIDADHQLVNVTHDWNTYNPMAAPGALVILHDITPTSDPSINVAPLWNTLTATHTTTTIQEPGGFGIGIVKIPANKPVFYGGNAA